MLSKKREHTFFLMSKFFLLFLCRLRERRKNYSFSHSLIHHKLAMLYELNEIFCITLKIFSKLFRNNQKVKNIHTAELTTFSSFIHPLTFFFYIICVMWIVKRIAFYIFSSSSSSFVILHLEIVSLFFSHT